MHNVLFPKNYEYIPATNLTWEKGGNFNQWKPSRILLLAVQCCSLYCDVVLIDFFAEKCSTLQGMWNITFTAHWFKPHRVKLQQSSGFWSSHPSINIWSIISFLEVFHFHRSKFQKLKCKGVSKLYYSSWNTNALCPGLYLPLTHDMVLI